MLASQARRRVYELSLQDCSQVLSSLSKMKVKDLALLCRVQERLINEGAETCTPEGVVNLMTAFARFGTRSTSRADVWPVLADELALRITQGSRISRTDQLASLMSYSFSHIGSAHDGLFSAVSQALCADDPSDVLPLSQVIRYVKACSRVQFRAIPTLSMCAQSIRSSQEDMEKLSHQDILELFTGLGKLGVEVKELNTELTRRGISIPESSVTWYRQAPPNNVEKLSRQSSLRRRKWTW